MAFLLIPWIYPGVQGVQRALAVPTGTPSFCALLRILREMRKAERRMRNAKGCVIRLKNVEIEVKYALKKA